MSNKFGILELPTKQKKDDFPCDPLLWVTVNPIGIKEGENILSGSLASEAEIDFTINSFISDLEIIRKKMKRKIKPGVSQN